MFRRISECTSCRRMMVFTPDIGWHDSNESTDCMGSGSAHIVPESCTRCGHGDDDQAGVTLALYPNRDAPFGPPVALCNYCATQTGTDFRAGDLSRLMNELEERLTARVRELLAEAREEAARPVRCPIEWDSFAPSLPSHETRRRCVEEVHEGDSHRWDQAGENRWAAIEARGRREVGSDD